MDLNQLQNAEFWTEYHQSAQAQIVKIDAMLKDHEGQAEKRLVEKSKDIMDV